MRLSSRQWDTLGALIDATLLVSLQVLGIIALAKYIWGGG